MQPIKWSSGDEKKKAMFSACFNVRDEYKSLTKEEIQQKVRAKSLPFAVIMSQIAGDFNFSSVIRSANGMGAREVFYFGKKQYDARGSVGCYHYTDVKFIRRFIDILKLKEQYCFVALENTNGANSLVDFVYPVDKPILFIIGEEAVGLPQEILDLADYIVEIPMHRGSVRSFNAASAATVAMYDFVYKYEHRSF